MSPVFPLSTPRFPGHLVMAGPDKKKKKKNSQPCKVNDPEVPVWPTSIDNHMPAKVFCDVHTKRKTMDTFESNAGHQLLTERRRFTAIVSLRDAHKTKASLF